MGGHFSGSKLVNSEATGLVPDFRRLLMFCAVTSGVLFFAPHLWTKKQTEAAEQAVRKRGLRDVLGSLDLRALPQGRMGLMDFAWENICTFGSLRERAWLLAVHCLGT